MKYLLLIVITLGFFICTSCDGRSRAQSSLKNALVKVRQHTKVTTVLKHSPAYYAEVETDTILKNGFTVKIKTYTDLNKAVSFNTSVTPYAIHKTLYHPLVSKITIEKEGLLVFDKVIDKTFYATHNAYLPLVNPNLLTQGIVVNQDATVLEPNAVYLSARFTYPNTKNSIEYQLKVDHTGNLR